MAERGKEFPLSIVLRTVDRATSGLKTVTDRIERQLQPYKAFSKQLGKFSESLSLPKLGKSLAGVGHEIRNLAGLFTGLAVGAGAALFGFKRMVDELDDLGDAAERLGVSVDFIASMRHAAERAGSSTEALDAGLQQLSANLGQASAGTGRMTAFLKKASPALLQQLKAAKNNEEAFNLLANAMAKLTKPAQRAALAQKTLGDATLAPLLQKGAKGLDEVRARYLKIAGSQQLAAQEAGKLDDEMKDFKATLSGLTASIVSGLGPVFRQLMERVRTFFMENRERIAKWIADFGEKLPGRIDAFIGMVKKLADIFQDVWDRIGGASGALAIFVGIKVLPLVTALLSVGAALIPIVAAAGPIIAMAAALGAIAAFVAVTKESTGKFQEAGGTLSEFQGGVFEVNDPRAEAAGARRRAREAIDRQISLQNAFAGHKLGASILGGAAPLMMQAAQGEARVKVDFANAPKGTRVTTDPRSTTDVDLSVGYQVGF